MASAFLRSQSDERRVSFRRKLFVVLDQPSTARHVVSFPQLTHTPAHACCSGASSFALSALLGKTKDVDSDLRFMALNDLAAEIHKPAFSIDAATETLLVDQVLALLSDVNAGEHSLHPPLEG
jgi:hypothetical protein